MKNKYKEVLELFTNKEELLRDALNNPFIVKDFVIATDSYSMVVINKNEIDYKEYEKNKVIENALKIIPEDEGNVIKYNINDLILAKDRILKRFNENFKYIESYCKSCRNEGMVEYEFEDHNGRIHRLTEMCPICDGGMASQEIYENKKTGFLYKEVKKIIEIENVHILLGCFEKVIKAAEILNVKTFYISCAKFPNPLKIKLGEAIILIALNIVDKEANNVIIELVKN